MLADAANTFASVRALNAPSELGTTLAPVFVATSSAWGSGGPSGHVVSSLAGTDRWQRGHAAVRGRRPQGPAPLGSRRCYGFPPPSPCGMALRDDERELVQLGMTRAELRDRPREPCNRRCSFAPPGRTAGLTGTQTPTPGTSPAADLVLRSATMPRCCSAITTIGGMRRAASRPHDRCVATGLMARSSSLAAAVAPTRHGVSGAWSASKVRQEPGA